MARMLNRRNGAARLPPLIFFTDPERTPDPAAVVARLPPGSAVVYRHFGDADRIQVARTLRRLTKRRRIKLLMGADAGLARRVDADGVHVPERLSRQVSALRLKHPRWLITASMHRHARIHGADALVLAPVLPSRSRSAIHPLGARTANAIARRCALPVYALGGVNARSAARLHAFAGLAAIDGLAREADQNRNADSSFTPALVSAALDLRPAGAAVTGSPTRTSPPTRTRGVKS